MTQLRCDRCGTSKFFKAAYTLRTNDDVIGTYCASCATEVVLGMGKAVFGKEVTDEDKSPRRDG